MAVSVLLRPFISSNEVCNTAYFLKRIHEQNSIFKDTTMQDCVMSVVHSDELNSVFSENRDPYLMTWTLTERWCQSARPLSFARVLNGALCSMDKKIPKFYLPWRLWKTKIWRKGFLGRTCLKVDFLKMRLIFLLHNNGSKDYYKNISGR